MTSMSAGCICRCQQPKTRRRFTLRKQLIASVQVEGLPSTGEELEASLRRALNNGAEVRQLAFAHSQRGSEKSMPAPHPPC